MGFLQRLLGRAEPTARSSGPRPAPGRSSGGASSAESLDDLARWSIFSARHTREQTEEYERYGADVIAATLAFHDGAFEKSRETFEELLGRQPEARYLHQDVGRAQFAAGKVREAVASFEKFVGAVTGELSCDGRLEAFVELARAYEELGDEDAAIDALGRCVDACDDISPKPYVALGNYLRVKGHLAEADEVLSSALPLEACCSGGTCGKSTDVQRELGLCRAARGDAASAVELLEPLTARAPALPLELGLALGRSYVKLERLEDAHRALSRISGQLDPATTAALALERAKLLESMGRADEASKVRDAQVHVMTFTMPEP